MKSETCDICGSAAETWKLIEGYKTPETQDACKACLDHLESMNLQMITAHQAERESRLKHEIATMRTRAGFGLPAVEPRPSFWSWLKWRRTP